MNMTVLPSQRVGEPDRDGERVELLMLALLAEGWRLTPDALVSPSESLFLPHRRLELEELRNRTARRLETALRAGAAAAVLAEELRVLFQVLEDLSVDGPLAGFFAPLAAFVRTFASQHELRVDRYPGGAPSIELLGRHPTNGWLVLELLRVGPDALTVGLLWRPSPGKREDQIVVWRCGELPRSPEVLAGLLGEVLDYGLDFIPPERWSSRSGIHRSPFHHPADLPLVFAANDGR